LQELNQATAHMCVQPITICQVSLACLVPAFFRQTQREYLVA
jgi:hypothetical protein